MKTALDYVKIDRVRASASYIVPRLLVDMSRAHAQVHNYAAIAQLVERIHGKDEVQGSNPCRGSITLIICCHSDRIVEYLKSLPP